RTSSPRRDAWSPRATRSSLSMRGATRSRSSRRCLVSSARSTSSRGRRSRKATSSRSSTSRSASPHIRLEPRGAVRLLTTDRQERRNALNGELCEAITGELKAHADLRAIVITGAGSAFCSGADLVTRFDEDGGDTFRPSFEKTLDAIVAYPAPVIAAINGPA